VYRDPGLFSDCYVRIAVDTLARMVSVQEGVARTGRRHWVLARCDDPQTPSHSRKIKCHMNHGARVAWKCVYTSQSPGFCCVGLVGGALALIGRMLGDVRHMQACLRKLAWPAVALRSGQCVCVESKEVGFEPMHSLAWRSSSASLRR
jgi:hypothetical protein